MTEGLKQWIMSILSCGVLFCMAEAILPNGAVRAVGRMSIGLVLFLVVLRPLTSTVPQAVAAFLQVDLSAVTEEQLQLKETNESYLETIMSEKSEEYIEAQAEAFGESVTAEVSCTMQDGLPVPEEAKMTGNCSADAVQQLMQIVEQDLGISKEQIQYEEVTNP